MIRNATLWTLTLVLVGPSVLQAEKFTVDQDKDGVTIKLNGKMLTRYVNKSGAKPILWPLIGPNGNEITRQYPMRDAAPGERNDHIHHRSFWFTHGDVNGISFWHENKGGGHINHREFVKVDGGDTAVIVTRNDWVGPDGKKHCEDIRKITFGESDGVTWIDFDTTVTASEGETVFGDTKEGCFGVRVAGTMKVDSKLGGHIVNSEGQKDKAAWGKPAKWCDYYGPVKDKTVGIAILNHPQSFRYPTHWHVRTYGLFTANPFGLHNFKGVKEHIGAHKMKKGDSFSLHYRVLIHKGDTDSAKIEDAFKKYAATKKSSES